MQEVTKKPRHFEEENLILVFTSSISDSVPTDFDFPLVERREMPCLELNCARPTYNVGTKQGGVSI